MVSEPSVKKVIFLTENSFGSSLGGLEQHIFHLARGMAERGFQVKILALRVGGASSFERREVSTPTARFTVEEYVRFNPLFFLTSFLNKYVSGRIGLLPSLLEKLLPNLHLRVLLRRVKEIDPTIIHQHDYFSNIVLTKFLARRWPVIFTNHTGQYLFLEKFRLTRWFQKFLLWHFDAVIGPSYELTPKNDRSIFIPNGVDVNFFSGIKSDSGERLVVICPRRWAPTKGVRYLAEALTMLSPEDQQKLIVRFAGSDSNDYPWYAKEVMDILRSLPENTYELLGSLDQNQLRDEYLRSDVVVIPSLMEATSLAAMEGMSCGLPVLSTNVGGMPDVVVSPLIGWLVEPRDSAALRDALSSIIANRSVLGTMGAEARNFVLAERSWDKISERTLLVYDDVIQDRRPRLSKSG